jgi:hypothetical protein
MKRLERANSLLAFSTLEATRQSEVRSSTVDVAQNERVRSLTLPSNSRKPATCSALALELLADVAFVHTERWQR